jgi:uncharacterized membrane protein YcaP (DUF421 family)
MITEEIAKLDWQGMLFGNTSTALLVELGVRLVIVLVALCLAVLIAGRRPVAQMSAAQLVGTLAVSALGVGSLFVSSVGIILVVSVLMVLLFFQLLLPGPRNPSRAATNHPDKVTTLVEDGRLKFETMKRRGISHEEIYTYLRTAGIEHLGQVRRLYQEVNGQFSVYRTQHSKPGLSILPEKERDLVLEMAVAGNFACADCGNVMVSESIPAVRCTRCGQLSWTDAVLELQKTEKPHNNLYHQRGLLQRPAPAASDLMVGNKS